MRGKDTDEAFYQTDDRITPAYAGKSFVRLALLARLLGSPPPMRGKEALYSAVQRGDRITPAYAGKSP